MGYWLAKFIFLGPLMRLLWRPWAKGLENIPTRGPVIIVSNHLSFCDSFFMPLTVGRKVTFLAKAEYFNTPGVKGRLTKCFMSAIGQVPVDRSDSDAARAALNTGVRLLGAGRILAVYPEGTRSPDGRLYRGKTGAARMTLASGAVIVPCIMIDTAVIQPAGRRLPRLRPRPGTIFGEPMDFSKYAGCSGDREAERLITDEVMARLQSMSGQEYVDVYAASVKVKTGVPRAFGERPVSGARRARCRHNRKRAS